MFSSWWPSLAGGLSIGLASALLLVAHGRIAGISGILSSVASPAPLPDRAWRLAFLVGLLLSGALAARFAPHAIVASDRSAAVLLIAGLLVGVGTRLAGGCTSGHGVCGLARFSRRSLAAVATFLLTGGLTAWLSRGLA